MITADEILNAKILVVDDKEANVELMEGILRVAGYTSVHSTMNPREVRELHRENHYGLILLDMHMPDMDGFQVMEGLTEIEADGYLPVLVITAQPQLKLRALEAALEKPKRPLVAVVGGAKISSKLDLLGNLSGIANTIVIGGAMANTFLAAQGHPVGKSLCEHDLADTARGILKTAAAKSCTILLPADVVVAKDFKANAPSRAVAFADVQPDDMILDVGPATAATINAAFDGARTLVWNGPLGAFELPPFDAATLACAKHAAALTAAGRLASIAGGGDTVSALNHAGVAEDFTYISTAGGAFLEWLEGKPLPGVKALEETT